VLLLQLRIAKGGGQPARLAKIREFLWRLAECYERMGCLAHAEAQLRELLGMPLASNEQRLEALCFLADIQVPCTGHAAACRFTSVCGAAAA
jgi:hypothetical protein